MFRWVCGLVISFVLVELGFTIRFVNISAQRIFITIACSYDPVCLLSSRINGSADLKTRAKIDNFSSDTTMPGAYYKRCLRKDEKPTKVDLENLYVNFLIVLFKYQQTNHFPFLSLLGNTFSKAMGSFKIPQVEVKEVFETRPRNNQMLYLQGKRSSLGSYPGLAVRLIG